MSSYLEKISSFTLVEGLIFVGAVGGGVTFLVSVCRAIRRWWRKTEEFALEYGCVQIIRHGNGHPSSVSVRAELHNPNDVPIRVRAEHMRTTFNEVTHNNCADDNHPEIDVTAHCGDVAVECRAIMLPAGYRQGQILDGRLDWEFRFGKVEKDGSADLRFTFVLRGSLQLHYFRHGIESRWAPDPGTPIPVIDAERLESAKGTEFHFKGH